MDEIVSVKELTKIYHIYDSPVQRLKEALSLSGKSYGKEFYALDHINFSVKKGETLGIIGENGAGKSTLLKIITGVLKPSSGEILLNGKVSALLELGVGFNPEYTGIENIYLSGTVLRISKTEMDKKVKDILDFADIGDFIYQKVKTYSSGMFARLAFSVAIHVEPEILIVDEALSVGDLFFQQKCNLYMKEKMKDCTKLLVTHDMATIGNMADKAVVLSHGKLVFYGDPFEAIEYYTKQSHNELFQKKVEKKEVTQELYQQDFNDWSPIPQNSLAGALDVKITSFRLWVNDNEYPGYVKDNSKIKIEMMVVSQNDLYHIMVGYQLKDKYGNVIFGENSKSSGFEEIELKKRKKYILTLQFRWPQIQKNNYFLTLGIGEGSDSMQHVIQCWAHNVIEISNITTRPDHGLLNNPIISFDLKEVEYNA